jgi:uncharacterized membrane protein
VTDPEAASPDEVLFGAERAKAFTDAVVAIAMTLLILPLMESVSTAASEGLTTAQWLSREFWPLFSFVLSFVIIANFWVSHHRIFNRVHGISTALLWITIAWMLTIVWMPVVTALVGQITADPLQKILYIGAMLVASLLLAGSRVYLRTHPRLHDIPNPVLRRGIIVELVMSFLFGAALVVALVFPETSYYPLFLLVLTRPMSLFALRVLPQGAPEETR